MRGLDHQERCPLHKHRVKLNPCSQSTSVTLKASVLYLDVYAARIWAHILGRSFPSVWRTRLPNSDKRCGVRPMLITAWEKTGDVFSSEKGVVII